MSEELWGGIGTAAINQIGNIISTGMTNASNERMQQEQNKWNLEQWNRNNAYKFGHVELFELDVNTKVAKQLVLIFVTSCLRLFQPTL